MKYLAYPLLAVYLVLCVLAAPFLFLICWYYDVNLNVGL